MTNPLRDRSFLSYHLLFSFSLKHKIFTVGSYKICKNVKKILNMLLLKYVNMYVHIKVIKMQIIQCQLYLNLILWILHV